MMMFMFTLPSRSVYFPFNVSNLDVKEISEPCNALVEVYLDSVGHCSHSFVFSLSFLHCSTCKNKNRT